MYFTPFVFTCCCECDVQKVVSDCSNVDHIGAIHTYLIITVVVNRGVVHSPGCYYNIIRAHSRQQMFFSQTENESLCESGVRNSDFRLTQVV